MLAMEDRAEKAMLYQNPYQRKRSSNKLATLQSFAWLFLEEQINCAEFWFFCQLAVGVVKLNKILLNFDSFISCARKYLWFIYEMHLAPKVNVNVLPWNK